MLDGGPTIPRTYVRGSPVHRYFRPARLPVQSLVHQHNIFQVCRPHTHLPFGIISKTLNPPSRPPSLTRRFPSSWACAYSLPQVSSLPSSFHQSQCNCSYMLARNASLSVLSPNFIYKNEGIAYNIFSNPIRTIFIYNKTLNE